MKTKLLALVLLAGSSVFAATRVSVGIGIGGGYAYGGYYPAPPPPPAYVVQPPCPGPGYYWVQGTWLRVGPRWSWQAGYWAPPRFGGGYYRHYDNHRHYDRGYRGRWDNGYRRH